MSKPWARWYDTALWKHRRLQQLRQCPLCAFHEQEGRIVAASIADHVRPHKGNWLLFSRGELQSLCPACHSRRKQQIEVNGFDDTKDASGRPVDPRHPFNEQR
jgi:5-methylcytosine-specific restriction protein A